VATYKLIQDIEAEDHILGPLTLRQFIFGLIAAFGYYLCFIIFVKHVYFLLVLFLPPTLFCTFFAVPFGRDQPTEVWALAKLHFWFKPRRRIWDQSGMKELVTITVPKKVERVLTNGLDQTEVQSRLKALANTLDSRGWVVKNATANTYANPLTSSASSDRLIDIDTLPQEVPVSEAQAADDILDESNNPTAHKFEDMISASTEAHRKQLMDELNDIRAGESAKQANQPQYWFTNQQAAASQAPIARQPTVSGPAPAAQAQPPSANDAALAARLRQQNAADDVSYAHLRTLRPSSMTAQQPGPNANSPRPPTTTVTPPSDPAILALADRNDLNVSTIAREAYKAKNGDEPPRDEVVVSLH
jgi:hypothetical protein